MSRQNLPLYMISEVIALVADLPRTPRGKTIGHWRKPFCEIIIEKRQSSVGSIIKHIKYKKTAYLISKVDMVQYLYPEKEPAGKQKPSEVRRFA